MLADGQVETKLAELVRKGASRKRLRFPNTACRYNHVATKTTSNCDVKDLPGYLAHRCRRPSNSPPRTPQDRNPVSFCRERRSQNPSGFRRRCRHSFSFRFDFRRGCRFLSTDPTELAYGSLPIAFDSREVTWKQRVAPNYDYTRARASRPKSM